MNVYGGSEGRRLPSRSSSSVRGGVTSRGFVNPVKKYSSSNCHPMSEKRVQGRKLDVGGLETSPLTARANSALSLWGTVPRELREAAS